MDPKRWFAWVCLALMVVAEIFLFRASHERDAAQTELRDVQHQLRQAQTELAGLKNSGAGTTAAEISSLRKQNEALSSKAISLQKNIEQLNLERQQAAQHLTTARTALQLQQEHLQQFQAETDAARASVQAQQRQRTDLLEASQRNACINHLRQMDAAKNQWALENNRTTGAMPTAQDIAPYIKLDANGNIPGCPAGGTYTIGAIGEAPTCSIPDHALSQ
jgi:chromosome segregation ATPase